MRFTPVSTAEETIVIRFRIPLELQARYQVVSKEKQMDVSDLYCQALVFAAGGDPAEGAARTRKRRSKLSKMTDKI